MDTRAAARAHMLLAAAPLIFLQILRLVVKASARIRQELKRLRGFALHAILSRGPSSTRRPHSLTMQQRGPKSVQALGNVPR
jgi:hypothetical protein